ncbi:hypothetical protein IE53DRAFT_383525 [Violaceomyces palustris]|uniref:Uncharacterized protein n=1 Tax=Violaceomyces palustris TaxID=1673888 RepID=A0ACD0P705_9BASI|nr:hypothetical protein IE53DRAFT_383525 [Violaceomyces palustris]
MPYFSPLSYLPSLSLSQYLVSGEARVKAQREAQGTESGPTGAEVDAHVASTMTKKERSTFLTTKKEEEEQRQQQHKQNEIKEGVATEDGNSPTTPTHKVEGDASSEARPASRMLPTAKTLTKEEISELPVDERGRRLGLEDPDDPEMQDDPAIFAHKQEPTVEQSSVTKPGILAKLFPSAAVAPSASEEKTDEVGDGKEDEEGEVEGKTIVCSAEPEENLGQDSEATTSANDTEPLFPGIPNVAAPQEPPLTSVIAEDGLPYVDPRVYGGTSFDLVGNGEHEPLNIIISALSSPAILTRKGFQSYLRSLDYDKECLGLHGGGYQKAFLDPRGWLDQNFLYRQVYTPLDHIFGTCIESLIGGNHIRAWQQQGTGAWFLAASKEENLQEHHMIIPDGYNIGRDEFIRQSQKEKGGVTSFFFNSYRTKVEWVQGLMPSGIQGVNHDIAVDGRTAILTVTLLSKEEKKAIKAQNRCERQREVDERRQAKEAERKMKKEKKAVVVAAASATSLTKGNAS